MGLRPTRRRIGGIGAAFLVVTVIAGAAPLAVAQPSAQRGALAKLRADSVRPLVVRSDQGASVPSFVTGRIPIASFSSARAPADRGTDFWRTYAPAFGVRNGDELVLRSAKSDLLGMTHLRYDQRYRGLSVMGHQLVLHMDRTAVTAVNGDFAASLDLPTTAKVGAAAATKTARSGLGKIGARASRTEPELLVYVQGSHRYLAWRVTVPTTRPLGLWRVFVDALTGKVLRSYNDLKTAKNRSTYTNGNDPACPDPSLGCTLPGTLVRSEGQGNVADNVVNGAHNHAGTTYDYYFNTFGRDSYDGAGHEMTSTVHLGVEYNNAFWCDDACAADFGSAPDGEQMAYGDGDGVVFSPLANDLDVVAHELTHAVTSSEADLMYVDQSGALNESYSDVFAAMVDTDNWLIGEDSFTPGVPGDALRSLQSPTLFDQPGSMSQFVHTVYDNGGVHTNSGIPNRAAYLTSEGPGYGIGRADTQRIYYRALTMYLTPTSDFVDNLNALRQSAIDIFGAGTAQVRAVERANAAVGIVNRPTVIAPNGGEMLQSNVPTTIEWNPGGDNNAAFAVQYRREGAPVTYSQQFPGASLPAGFTSGGNKPWVPDASTFASAPRSVRSGAPLAHNQRSELRITKTMTAPGNVNFRARVSSERDFDFFTFWVDGVLELFGSGSIPWSAVPPTMVSAGTHTFLFVYEKDFSVSSGLDRAWIDNLVIPNSESPATTIATTAAGATTQSWNPPLVQGSNFKIRVAALGAPAWLASDDSDATFSVDAPPLFRINDVSVREGNSGTKRATLTVRLSEAALVSTTVRYSTANGTAKSPSDYASKSGMLTFQPGQVSKTLFILVKGDRRNEPNERFFVNLRTPTGGAVIVDRQGRVTIVDNE